jgi:hypothetical protein
MPFFGVVGNETTSEGALAVCYAACLTVAMTMSPFQNGTFVNSSDHLVLFTRAMFDDTFKKGGSQEKISPSQNSFIPLDY